MNICYFDGVAKSSIEWTESTWNPVTGCDKISTGCKHCYAERMAIRLKAMGQANYRNGFQLALQPQNLLRPLQWKKPQRIFVNSMSDLFHADVPLDYIQRVFDTIVQAHWHRFQILTKRAERLMMLAKELPWPANLWMGVSLENDRYLSRIDYLRKTPAQVRFLSIEPLLGAMPALNLKGIHWVIVGGESGPRARPMKLDWARGLRDQCALHEVPFFMKQLGGNTRKGNSLDDIPPDLQVRQWPPSPTVAFS